MVSNMGVSKFILLFSGRIIQVDMSTYNRSLIYKHTSTSSLILKSYVYLFLKFQEITIVIS